MGKHEVPAGPGGRVARLRRQVQPRRERRSASVPRFFVSFFPAGIASGFMEHTDTAWYFHPFLVVFGALLPLAGIGGLAALAVNATGERRARRLMRPRPRRAYLFMALGWALAATAFRLLGWAAGGGPDGTGDWIVTALGWSFMISVCAALMMLGRSATAGPVRGRGLVRPRPFGRPLPVAVINADW